MEVEDEASGGEYRNTELSRENERVIGKLDEVVEAITEGIAMDKSQHDRASPRRFLALAVIFLLHQGFQHRYGPALENDQRATARCLEFLISPADSTSILKRFQKNPEKLSGSPFGVVWI